MSHFKFLASIALTVALGIAASACSPEEYSVCSIPSTGAYKNACTATNQQASTCVVKYVFDCDSLLCGIYNDEGPYCTRACTPAPEACSAAGYTDCSCPEGVDCVSSCPDGGDCVEWTKGTSAFYCVKPTEQK